MKVMVHPSGCKGVVCSPAGRFTCALGRSGVTADKREGDGATPVGVWPVRRLLYRPDRLAAGRFPTTRLEVMPIGPDDGWCDAPDHPLYNRPVALPFSASHERLWRDDGLYDLVTVLGHNDDPAIPGGGSAIFMHLARPDYAPTEGCVALARPDLEALLAILGPEDLLEICAQE